MTYYMEDILDITVREMIPKMHAKLRSSLNHYLGVRTMRSPMDSWVYQQIIWETKPDVLVEIGQKWGGSALMFSHIFKNAGLNTRIIGVDHNHKSLDKRVRDIPNSTFIEGDATESFEKVKKLITDGEKVMVMDDSAHTYAVTLSILNTYYKLVTPGQYFIVEDGIMNHGLKKTDPNFNVYQACVDFTENHPEFIIDRERELFILTYNPKGYLRRKV